MRIIKIIDGKTVDVSELLAQVDAQHSELLVTREQRSERAEYDERTNSLKFDFISKAQRDERRQHRRNSMVLRHNRYGKRKGR